jgi:hypothetical protein
LAARCLECHNAHETKGGLNLTRRETALSGGDSGAAIDPAHPAESRILRRIAAGEMPPKGRSPLGPEESKLLLQWIVTGAAWPSESIDPWAHSTDSRAGYDWWSLQPISPNAPPAVKDEGWVRNPIDRFIVRGLETAGLRPAPGADRRTLVRRVWIDLLGLPPTPEEVEKFVADDDPRAYERLVDRLLE